MTQITAHPLRSGLSEVSILTLGCTTQFWRTGHAGRTRSVVLGYADPADYLTNPIYTGVIVGRVANRIGGATFSLDGQRHRLAANEGANQLHGGLAGLGTQIWQASPDGDRAIQLTHTSPHGAQGYPGQVEFSVTIMLSGTTLTYDLRASVDRPTPINMAQHNYYNLMGHGTIWDHTLHVPADRFVAVDQELIPTGALEPVAGQPFDHRAPSRIGDADPDHTGSDISYVMNNAADSTVTLTAPDGLRLTMKQDQPGLQFYTGGGIFAHGNPLPGQTHIPFGGIALEPQGLPDAVNNPQFPSVICTPDNPYHQRMILTLDTAP